jgi:hypothetical protein
MAVRAADIAEYLAGRCRVYDDAFAAASCRIAGGTHRALRPMQRMVNLVPLFRWQIPGQIFLECASLGISRARSTAHLDRWALKAGAYLLLAKID